MRHIDTAVGKGDRPFQGFDDFGNRNHTGRAGQGITTVRAALGNQQICLGERFENFTHHRYRQAAMSGKHTGTGCLSALVLYERRHQYDAVIGFSGNPKHGCLPEIISTILVPYTAE
jgi:hypothetical protein